MPLQTKTFPWKLGLIAVHYGKLEINGFRDVSESETAYPGIEFRGCYRTLAVAGLRQKRVGGYTFPQKATPLK